MQQTVTIYQIKAENVLYGGAGSTLINDKSTHFNFTDCNIGLQGHLNDLAQLLVESGQQDAAKALTDLSGALEKNEDLSNPKEVRKSGLVNRIKRLIDEMSDETSMLNKTVKGVKNGISIGQDIAKGYNTIAKWVPGMPTVPEAYLKKESKEGSA